MKLLLKFNLVFLLVFVVGLLVSGLVARTLLQRDAQAEVLDRARLLMEKAMVVSSYTASQIAPLLATQMKYTFLPQSIPAYSSTEVVNALQKTYPELTVLGVHSPEFGFEKKHDNVVRAIKELGHYDESFSATVVLISKVSGSSNVADASLMRKIGAIRLIQVRYSEARFTWSRVCRSIGTFC